MIGCGDYEHITMMIFVVVLRQKYIKNCQSKWSRDTGSGSEDATPHDPTWRKCLNQLKLSVLIQALQTHNGITDDAPGFTITHRLCCQGSTDALIDGVDSDAILLQEFCLFRFRY